MATATPVAISSISRTSGVTTVTTATNHGLVSGQSCSLVGVTDTSFIGNWTITSVTSATVFVCAQPTALGASSSSSGTSQPSKEVITLNVRNEVPGYNSVTFLLWLPTAFPVPTTASSLWTGASTAENAAIQAGYLIELVKTDDFPVTAAKAQIEGYLQLEFTAALAVLNASAGPGAYYGIYFDGSGWSG